FPRGSTGISPEFCRQSRSSLAKIGVPQACEKGVFNRGVSLRPPALSPDPRIQPDPTQSKARGITGVIIHPPPPLGFLFVVPSTGDGDNTGVGAVCDDGTGNCTLRATIEVANANTGDDTIK